ncbi:uncharacterized protein LOC134837861 [Culicoides brevitarsis]|uniref:uncharacterized protein LOC134837861 n=1 Tax=Culicoides brevitarsis TaxID=469753 RepID=UPI00307BBF96
MSKILLCLCIITASLALELQKCKEGDSDCILNTINNQVLPYGKYGVPSMHIPPLDPLKVKTLTIEQGGSSSVNVKLYFRDLEYEGFSRARMQRFKMKDGKLNFDAHVPIVTQMGQYKISGNVLILPISGNGLSNMTFVDSLVKFRSTTKMVERNGEQYIQIDQAKLRITTSRLYYQFNNLFNGNQALGDNMNRFLNRNWETIFTETREPIQNSFSDVVKNYINNNVLNDSKKLVLGLFFNKILIFFYVLSNMKSILLLLAALVSLSAAAFPTSSLPQCKRGDTKCIMDLINNVAFRKLYNGLPELGMASMDPLKADRLTIEQGGNSPVRIKLYFKDVIYNGLRNGQITKLEGFGDTIDKSRFNFEIKLPIVTQLGAYKINGQVLILPIQGTGQSNMTFVNPSMKFRSVLKVVNKNGQEYMQIEKAKINIETSRLIMHFTNLFNGDKALGDNMNLFLNENWKDIFAETKKSIENAFVNVIKNYINDVFNVLPYKELFAQ